MSLRKSTDLAAKKTSSRICLRSKFFFSLRETSFCTCHKASYTLEAAVIIPMLTAFFVTLLFFFRIIQVQCAVEEAIMFAGRKTAIESSVIESPELLLISAKAYVLYALEDCEVVDQYVKGGKWGVTLVGSNCKDEEINLRANYTVSLPINLWDIAIVKLYSQNTFQKWNGDVQTTETEEEEWVYVTKSGTVYHSSLSCRVLNISVREVTESQIEKERGKDGQKYYPCSRCKNEENSGIVYCTDYGTLYHRAVSCSYLTRTINKVKPEEAEHLKPCSYCGEE